MLAAFVCMIVSISEIPRPCSGGSSSRALRRLACRMTVSEYQMCTDTVALHARAIPSASRRLAAERVTVPIKGEQLVELMTRTWDFVALGPGIVDCLSFTSTWAAETPEVL